VFVGSPEFIAPERVLGQRPGPASDLWSLGVVLYVALEGLSPFRRSNSPATLQAVLSSEPQTPDRTQSQSGGLAMLITRLLRKSPADRPDVAEVRAALEEAARPPQPQPQPVPVGGRLLPALRQFRQRMRGSRGWRYGTGAVVVAIAAAVSLIVYLGADQVPDGWTRNDKDEKLVGATVGVPPGYKRSAADDHVTYTNEKAHITIELVRVKNGVQSTALKEANSRKKYYEDGADEGGLDTMADVSAEVTEVEGEDYAADLFTEYADEKADSISPPARHRFERVYVKSSTTAWRLSLTTTEDGADQGKRDFEEATATMDIDDL
jgi:eukaryotic-like serine/threonine-protein kinase